MVLVCFRRGMVSLGKQSELYFRDLQVSPSQYPTTQPASQGWAYELLYIPFILPFVVAGCAPLLVFRRELDHSFGEIVHAVLHRIKGPAIALSGALMLVELLRTSDHLKDAPAIIIGTRLSETLSHAFVALSFPLGALGSFFSGSTTVSNLTFTQVQKVAADKLGRACAGIPRDEDDRECCNICKRSIGVCMGGCTKKQKKTDVRGQNDIVTANYALDSHVTQGLQGARSKVDVH